MNKKLILTIFLYIFSITAISYIIYTKIFIYEKEKINSLNFFKTYINEMYKKDFKNYSYYFKDGENSSELMKLLLTVENNNYIMYSNNNKLDKFYNIYNGYLEKNIEFIKTEGIGILPYYKNTYDIIINDIKKLDIEFKKKINN